MKAAKKWRVEVQNNWYKKMYTYITLMGGSYPMALNQNMPALDTIFIYSLHIDTSLKEK